jgi:hypothetical protein
MDFEENQAAVCLCFFKNPLPVIIGHYKRASGYYKSNCGDCRPCRRVPSASGFTLIGDFSNVSFPAIKTIGDVEKEKSSP